MADHRTLSSGRRLVALYRHGAAKADEHFYDMHATHGGRPFWESVFVSTTHCAAGGVIGDIIGGINSDMPGMVIGQVSDNVCETATGRYPLIPQRARLIGAYDNMVANGQTRIGVIWNRIIHPNAESIDLGSMEGADQGGYADFDDQVNTHFWSKGVNGEHTIASILSGSCQLLAVHSTRTFALSPCQG